MPGKGGMDLLKEVRDQEIDSNLIIMTAYGTIETAVEAMKNGAFDYLTKPFSKDELLVNVEKAVKAFNLFKQNLNLKEELEYINEEQKLVGKSREMQGVFDLIRKVSNNDKVNVLITGESGTGKELVAREIHARSVRAEMPFVPVNCSAIPEILLESELFGYRKGAFTGAVSNREGKFKKANYGTIFLDEIADMPLSMQVKLLRVIQDKEVTPVGGDESFNVDVRIISATNKNLKALVEKGNFRDDLYYRLNVVPIHIPSLRERREDIPLLIEHITHKLNRKLNKNISPPSREIVNRFMGYGFPGNVRELENMLERSFILSDNGVLKSEHFPLLTEKADKEEKSDAKGTLKEISLEARKIAEREAIKEALLQTDWNKVKTTKILGVDYKTLRTKMKAFDIKPQFEERSDT
jgi:DNA-binding NtrC family response regulator